MKHTSPLIVIDNERLTNWQSDYKSTELKLETAQVCDPWTAAAVTSYTLTFAFSTSCHALACANVPV
jgi:hypothetical protein